MESAFHTVPKTGASAGFGMPLKSGKLHPQAASSTPRDDDDDNDEEDDKVLVVSCFPPSLFCVSFFTPFSFFIQQVCA